MSSKSLWRVACTLGASALLFAVCFSQNVKPGIKAPPIQVAEWIKGKPLTQLDKSKLYVFEFWATWCGPCKESMPHLSRLARTYRDKVEFVGVSVLERGDDIPGKVRKFIAEMGDKVDYAIALDDAGAMDKTWLSPTRLGVIPTSFLVSGDGTILWIGPPTELDPVLQKAIAGKLDLAASIKEFDEKVGKRRELTKAGEGLQEAQKLIGEGRKEEAQKLLTELKNSDTNTIWATQIEIMLLDLRAQDNPKDVAEEIEKLVVSDPKKVQMAILLIRRQNAPKGNRSFALDLASRLVKRLDDSDPNTWYQLGTAYQAMESHRDALICFERTRKSLYLSKMPEESKKVFDANLEKMMEKSKKKING